MKAVRSVRRWQRIKRDRKSRSETVKRNKQTELIDWNISFVWYYWPQAGLFWAAEHWGEMRFTLVTWASPDLCSSLSCIRACSPELVQFPRQGLRVHEIPQKMKLSSVLTCCYFLFVLFPLSCRGSAVLPCPAFCRKHRSMSYNPLATLWRTWPCSSILLPSSRTLSALFFVLIILTRLSSDF